MAKWFFTSPKDPRSYCSACEQPTIAPYVLIAHYKRFINPDDLKDLSYEERENRIYRCADHAPKCHSRATKERDARKK